MSGDGFDQLKREQIQMRRDLATKLDKGGPYSKARAQRLRAEADRMERLLDEAEDAPPAARKMQGG